MNTKVEIGIMQPQAKEGLESPEAGIGKEVFSPSLLKEHSPADTLDFRLWPPEL